MASQPSDRLKAILLEARARAQAASAAAPTPQAPPDTDRVEALIDRREGLPDPRALARLYRDRALVDRLPEDDEHEAPTAPAPSAVTGPALYSPPPAQASTAGAAPAHQPLSPSQIREVMDDIRHQFTSQDYMTFEPKQVPDEVIPFADDPDEDAENARAAEVHTAYYILGGIIALMVVAVFVYLAAAGPLRYQPPANAGSPAASASPAKR